MGRDKARRKGTSGETFSGELQRALQHLYNPAELRKSPLLALFGVAEARNPLTALQRILTDAIQALQPGEDVPAHANAWRIYHVLTYRYIEQMSQQEVARDMAISVRQLRRQEKAAIQVLADYLWDHHNIEVKAGTILVPPPQVKTGESAALPDRAGQVSRENELEWLKESLPSEIAGAAGVIETALKTVSPLARSLGVQIACTVPEDVPMVSGPLPTIRQALLSLLTAAVQAVPGGRVQIAAKTGPEGSEICVDAIPGPAGLSLLSSELAEKLGMTRQLTEIFGGRVDLLPARSQEHFLEATLTLPAAEQITVLVVDDNADTLQLLQRYLSGTRYSFAGTRDPEQALVLAEEWAPHIVVMDVMLLGIDGWELLGRFREHPKTRAVPVIVCTILPQEQLALTLGAAGFLRKPVSREALLKELDRQVESSRMSTSGVKESR